MGVEAYLDRGLRRWIVNEAKRQLWRMPNWYTIEDLIQDGHGCAAKVAVAYPKLGAKKRPNSDDRRMFMRLLQSTFRNHCHNLAVKRQHGEETPVTALADAYSDDGDSVDFFDRHGSNTMNEGLLKVLIAEAPHEIKALFGLLHEDGFRFAERKYTRLIRILNPRSYQRPHIVRKARPESMNVFLCRLLGLNPSKVDIHQMVVDYFNPHRPELARPTRRHLRRPIVEPRRYEVVWHDVEPNTERRLVEYRARFRGGHPKFEYVPVTKAEPVGEAEAEGKGVKKRKKRAFV